MKPLLWIGIVLLVLGLGSLVVPIPNNERSGVKVGGLSVGVETQRDEKVSPIISAVLILGGAGLLFAGKTKG